MKTLAVRITPNAKADILTVDEHNVILARVTSPPIDGKANSHLVKLLSKKLRVAKSSIKIVRGETSRNKTIAIDGLTCEEAVAKLKN